MNNYITLLSTFWASLMPVVLLRISFMWILFSFAAMEELDGDDVRVSFNGRKASRDIVQVGVYLKNEYMSSSELFALKQWFL